MWFIESCLRGRGHTGHGSPEMKFTEEEGEEEQEEKEEKGKGRGGERGREEWETEEVVKEEEEGEGSERRREEEGRGEKTFSHSEWSSGFYAPPSPLQRLSFPGNPAKVAALLSHHSLSTELDLVTRRHRPMTSILVTHFSVEMNEGDFPSLQGNGTSSQSTCLTLIP